MNELLQFIKCKLNSYQYCFIDWRVHCASSIEWLDIASCSQLRYKQFIEENRPHFYFKHSNNITCKITNHCLTPRYFHIKNGHSTHRFAIRATSFFVSSFTKNYFAVISVLTQCPMYLFYCNWYEPFCCPGALFDSITKIFVMMRGD